MDLHPLSHAQAPIRRVRPTFAEIYPGGTTEGEAATPPPSLASDLAELARVRACPHLERRTDCGCGVNRCRAGRGPRGDGLVTLDDCRACVRNATA